MPGKLCLILMRDDGRSRRWRIGPNMRRVLAAVLVLAPLVTVGSLVVNWRLYRDQLELQTEVINLRSQLETKSQLNARLINLEQYLEQYDPGALRSLAVGRTDAFPELGWVYAPVESVDVGDAVTLPYAPGESQQAVSPEDASTSSSAETVAQIAPVSRHPDILREAPIDKGLARLENIVARRVGARILRISFDLYNAEVREQLAGRTGFELILPDGSLYPLDARGDTHYRINRLKRIVGNPTMPADVTETEGAYIRITVFENNDIINRLLVPLQN